MEKSCFKEIPNKGKQSANKKLTIRISVLQWIVYAIAIPVNALFISGLWLFNDQVPGIFSKNALSYWELETL